MFEVEAPVTFSVTVALLVEKSIVFAPLLVIIDTGTEHFAIQSWNTCNCGS